MDAALVGLLGVLLGILLNERLRRRNRIENYSTSVFTKRLEIYEGLHEILAITSDLGREVIENTELDYEQRHGLVSAGVHQIAEYCDKNELYINEEIVVHVMALLMGVEDIQDIENEEEKAAQIEQFRENLFSAKKMIRKEAGITDIEELFGSITKASHSSPVVDYFKQRRKELGTKGKWE